MFGKKTASRLSHTSLFCEIERKSGIERFEFFPKFHFGKIQYFLFYRDYVDLTIKKAIISFQNLVTERNQKIGCDGFSLIAFDFFKPTQRKNYSLFYNL